MANKWVIFGSTGVCGKALLQLLGGKDVQVVAVSRKAEPPADVDIPDNVSFAQGDVLNAEAVNSLCAGAAVIVSALGLAKYQAKAWADNWPTIIENLTSAAKSEGALFAFIDNLYSFGAGSISMDTPHIEPTTKSKPGVRVILRQQLVESGARFVSVGAADYFGPGATTLSFLGDSGAGRIVDGNKPLAIGSADVRHDFAYVPDISLALLTVAEHALAAEDDVTGRFWIAPHAIKQQTLREITSEMATIAGKPEVAGKVTTLPSFLIRVLGFVVPFMGEMREMLPWWTKDYAVDDSAFCYRFQQQPTDYKAALSKTVKWFADRKKSAEESSS